MNASNSVDVKVIQTRDDWQMTVTIQVKGIKSEAMAAWQAGGITAVLMQNGLIKPCEITHNFKD